MRDRESLALREKVAIGGPAQRIAVACGKAVIALRNGGLVIVELGGSVTRG